MNPFQKLPCLVRVHCVDVTNSELLTVPVNVCELLGYHVPHSEDVCRIALIGEIMLRRHRQSQLYLLLKDVCFGEIEKHCRFGEPVAVDEGLEYLQ